MDDAAAQIDVLQTCVGSLESYTLDSMTGVLSATEVNLTDSIELIENVDEAAETAQLVRNQLLAENSLAALYITSKRSTSLLQILDRISFG